VAGLKGRRQHAKTDQADAKHLRELLEAGKLPESWIPPVLVRETRAKVRLYKDLLDERGGWQQRIAAVLYHHGAPARPDRLHGDQRWLDAEQALSPSGRQAITVAWRIIDALDAELLRLRGELTGFARRQAGCRQLQREYGIGPLISVVVWSELGDTRRFHASRNAVRHTGLDISVYSLRRQTLPRTPDPPRSAAAAPGTVRGGVLRLPIQIPRPRLPPASRRPGRQTPSPDVSGPQTRPPLPPPAARPRRRGVHHRMTTQR
jgi:transposase